MYGVFGGNGQRSLPVGVEAVVEEGPTGAIVVSGGTVVVGPTGVVEPTDVVGTPAVVDAIGVVGPTEVVGSTVLVPGLVPVLVSTTMEPSEFVVVIAVVKVFGVVDLTGAVVTAVVVSTTVEPSEFVVVSMETKVDDPLDEANEYKVASPGPPQHSAMLPLHDVQVFSSGRAVNVALEPQLHVSPGSHQCRTCKCDNQDHLGAGVKLRSPRTIIQCEEG